MSLPPHREKDAKVEGRDPPETVKSTMAPFKSLMSRILKVPMTEVTEQQKSYETSRKNKVGGSPKALTRKGLKSVRISGKAPHSPKEDRR